MTDTRTSIEYDNGKPAHVVQWITHPDGTATELYRMPINQN